MSQATKGQTMKTIRWQIVMEGEGEYPSPFKTALGVHQDLERRGIAYSDRENFCVYLLDTKHRPVGFEIVSVGILNGSVIHPREIFKAAIVANAAAIILVHNHPSGEPEPSAEDGEVTRSLVDAGKLLRINVLDHVITGPAGKFYSYQEAGKI